jgi:hypothetical protein
VPARDLDHARDLKIKGAVTISDARMAGLTVSIYDIPLECDAAEICRKIVLHNGELEKQEEINAVKWDRAPSL